MEFWGVQVKPGKPLKIEPEDGYIIHVSQASLGETKKENESVPLYLKVGDQNFVMGTLVSGKFPQLSLDLFFEREFELSHDRKNGSVFVLGYKSQELMDGEDEGGLYSDFDDSEDEEVPMALPGNGKPKAEDLKTKNEKKPKVEETKKDVEEGDESSDDDDHDDEDDNDVSDSEGADKMGSIKDDSGDSEDSDDSDDLEDSDDSNDSGEEEEEKETPKKVEPPSKKRPNDAAVKTPVSKKARTETPQKTDGKKGGQTASPHPAKAGNKGTKSPKSGGQLSCGSCRKSFSSEVGLQSHNKAKHGVK